MSPLLYARAIYEGKALCVAQRKREHQPGRKSNIEEVERSKPGPLGYLQKEQFRQVFQTREVNTATLRLILWIKMCMKTMLGF